MKVIFEPKMIISSEITVLMSVYNGAEFLQEAIDSILTQTFSDFEFLIIDDGSTDDSVQIIESYTDDRIKLIRNTQNIGLTKSLNRGISLASGKYIVRMDADDVSLPHRIKKLVSYMNENDHVAVCGSWLVTIGENNRVWKSYSEDSEIKTQMLFYNSIFHPTVIIRKSCLEEENILYDETLKTAQDYDMWVRIGMKAELGNIQEVLLKHRIHSGSIGRVFQREQTENANLARKKMLECVGLTANFIDVEKHMTFFDIDIKSKKKFVVDSLVHFSNLIVSNRKSKFIKNFFLEKILARKWKSICDHYSFFELSSFLGLKYSLMKKLVDFGLLDEYGFFMQSLENKGGVKQLFHTGDS